MLTNSLFKTGKADYGVEVKPLKTDEDEEIPLDDLQPDDIFDTVKNYFVYQIYWSKMYSLE